MVFMLDVVLRTFDRISERSMGIQDFAEPAHIAGVLIVGMVAPSKVTKHPIDRFQGSVRTDFQNFVVVGEHRGFHNKGLPYASGYLVAPWLKASSICPLVRHRHEPI